MVRRDPHPQVQHHISPQSHLSIELAYSSTRVIGLYVPATKEKFEFGGSDDGETSGKETARRSAGLLRMFEKVWTYGYIV